jgi:nitrite reductase/ring-hydroxylating ferredoxin subunit
MNQNSLNWIRIDLTESEGNLLNNNEIIERSLIGREICLAKVGEQVFAFSIKCPHAGASLLDGSLNKRCEIVCSRHHYKFNLKNGHNSSGEGYFLKVFPVKLEANILFIGFR